MSTCDCHAKNLRSRGDNILLPLHSSSSSSFRHILYLKADNCCGETKIKNLFLYGRQTFEDNLFFLFLKLNTTTLRVLTIPQLREIQHIPTGDKKAKKVNFALEEAMKA